MIYACKYFLTKKINCFKGHTISEEIFFCEVLHRVNKTVQAYGIMPPFNLHFNVHW